MDMQIKPLLKPKNAGVFVTCIVISLIVAGYAGWSTIRSQSNKSSNQPPHAVFLDTPGDVDVEENSIWLDWSANTDNDFSRYEVHKSTINNFKIGLDTIVGTKRDQEKTYSFVFGLEASTTYYFKIRTYDSGALFSDSNEIGATTLQPNIAPQGVKLSQPTDIGATTLTLKWSKNQDEDFMQYIVAGSTDSDFEIDSENSINTIIGC